MNENNNIRSDAFWVRTLFMIVFWFVFRIAGFVLLLCTVVQWFSQLLSGERLEGLQDFCVSLGTYLHQISDYLTQVSDDKPYPFSDWPSTPFQELD